MPIQDDVREDVLIAQFDLIKYSIHSRGVCDATDLNHNKYELKSTTTNTVSTARDFSDKHITRWRSQYFIIGQWIESSQSYSKIYFLSPVHMEGWIQTIEKKINQRKDIAARVLQSNIVAGEEHKILKNMLERGCTFNCPPLPIKYVQSNGIPLYSIDQLRDLVNQYPIGQIPNTAENTLDRFMAT